MAKILVVDDNSGILDFLEEGLATFSYKVLRASNGEEALGLIESSNEEIDGIFCDCEMSVMDGPTFIRKIRSDPRFSNIPVIGMTGKSGNRQLLFDAGAQNVLNKPFGLEALEGAVNIIRSFKQSQLTT